MKMNEKDVRNTLPTYKTKEILKLEEKNERSEKARKRCEMSFRVSTPKTGTKLYVPTNLYYS